MNEQGRKYLNLMKNALQIPLVSKLSAFKDSSIDLDIRASRIYALGAANDFIQELINMEFSRPPVYIKSN